MAGDERRNKYVRISDELRETIQSGRWQVGDQIPSEPKLAEAYGVSRGTVRDAVDLLVEAGMLRKEQGRGTFVASTVPRLRKPEWLASFTDQLRDSRITPSTEVLETGVIAAGQAEGRVVEGFGVSEAAEVVYIRRLRRGDGVPLAIQTVYLLPERCLGILDDGVDLSHLFRLYVERYGVRIAYAHEIVRVVAASAEESSLLEIAPGESVVVRDRVSADAQERAFEVLHSVDRADRFVYGYHILSDSTRLKAQGH